MPLALRYIGGKGSDTGFDSSDIEVLICESPSFQHCLTLFSGHRDVCSTFNGFAPVICGVNAATITGFPAYCDNALQCKKREEKMKIFDKYVSILTSTCPNVRDAFSHLL